MNGGVSTSCSNYAKFYASAMPVLEDGLSSGHTSDTENNNNNKNLQATLGQSQAQAQSQGQGQGQALGQCQGQGSLSASTSIGGSGGISILMDMKRISTNNSLNSMHNLTASTTDSNGLAGGHHQSHTSPSNGLGLKQQQQQQSSQLPQQRELLGQSPSSNSKVFKNIDPDLDSLYSISK